MDNKWFETALTTLLDLDSRWNELADDEKLDAIRCAINELNMGIEN